MGDAHLFPVDRGLASILAGGLQQLCQASHKDTKEDDAQHKDKDSHSFLCRCLRGDITIAHSSDLQCNQFLAFKTQVRTKP